jgi:hypothetical protein
VITITIIITIVTLSPITTTAHTPLLPAAATAATTTTTRDNGYYDYEVVVDVQSKSSSPMAEEVKQLARGAARANQIYNPANPSDVRVVYGRTSPTAAPRRVHRCAPVDVRYCCSFVRSAKRHHPHIALTGNARKTHAQRTRKAHMRDAMR